MVRIRKKLEVALLTPHKFSVPYKTAKNPENIDKIRTILYKINIEYCVNYWKVSFTGTHANLRQYTSSTGDRWLYICVCNHQCGI